MSPAAQERRRTALPVLCVTGAAWIAIVARSEGSGLSPTGCCLPPSLEAAFSLPSLRLIVANNPPSSVTLAWVLMLLAMMTPMLASPLRHVIDRSFAQRRAWAVVLFLAGYLGAWVVAGAAIIPLALALRLLIPNPFAQAGVAATLAVAWQCSPAKQRCLNRSHSNPQLSAFGWAADLDVLRFGFTHGDWCVGSCWALMWFSEVLSSQHLAAMAVVTLWVLAEHVERPTSPRWRLRVPARAARLAIAQVGARFPLTGRTKTELV